jgi:hypothetical protein
LGFVEKDRNGGNDKMGYGTRIAGTICHGCITNKWDRSNITNQEFAWVYLKMGYTGIPPQWQNGKMRMNLQI